MQHEINLQDEHMSVFDIANNMTPAATSEQDEFSVIQITQPEMDELAGSEGFLSYTSPSTRELFIVRGLPKPIRDVAFGVDRERMRSGQSGPGLGADSVFDLIRELQRIERGPQLFPSDTEYMPTLPSVPSLPLPSVFGTPPLPGRVHGAAAAFTPSHPQASDYHMGPGRVLRKYYSGSGY